MSEKPAPEDSDQDSVFTNSMLQVGGALNQEDRQVLDFFLQQVYKDPLKGKTKPIATVLLDAAEAIIDLRTRLEEVERVSERVLEAHARDVDLLIEMSAANRRMRETLEIIRRADTHLSPPQREQIEEVLSQTE